MTRRSGQLVFAISVLFYLGLALAGIRYGLPDQDHTLSYVADETKWIEDLSLINPNQGRYNPHPECYDPTLYLGVYGASVYVTYKLGWLPIHQSKDWFLHHPDIFGRFYLVGRYLQILFGLLLLFTFWWTAEMVFGQEAAAISTFFLAISPALVSTSDFSQHSLPVASIGFLALASLLMGLVRQEKRLACFWAASLLTGLAIGTKYSALALLAPLAVFFLQNRLPIKFALFSGSLIVAGFVLACPFSVLAPRSFWSAFAYLCKNNQYPIPGWFDAISFPFKIAFPYALGAALSWFSWTVVLYFLVRKKTAALQLLLVWILGFYVMTVRVGMMCTSPRLLIVLPALLLLVGHFFNEISNKSSLLRKGCAAAFVLLVFFTARSTLAIVRFRRTLPIQKVASNWIKANIPRNKSIAVPRRIYWYTPDIVYQSRHHPERRENPYPVIELNLSKKMAEQLKPDFVVVSDLEKIRCQYWDDSGPWCHDLFIWLDSGVDYRVTKRFPRQLGIFGWEWVRPEYAKYPQLDDDDLKATALTIYQRLEKPGRQN